MSDNEDIVGYISACVDQFRSFYKISVGKAFMLWYATEALGLDQDAAHEAISFDGGNDKSIDLFYVDDQFERIIIAQGKFNSKGNYKPMVGEFLELIHASDWLKNPEALMREGREDLAAAAQDYNDLILRGYSIEYLFVYMGLPKRELQDAVVHFNNAELGSNPSRSARTVSLDLLRHAHDEYVDKSTRITVEKISVLGDQSFEQIGSYGRSLVISIPGNELKRLYEVHGDALFDRNVRLFLGARKGSVNAGIRDTLDSISDRQNFWAYNNGMTFVCDRYEFEEKAGELALYNFSIVNGCQTTVSIASASEKASSLVAVLARVIASSQESIIDSIITYTNRQTPNPALGHKLPRQTAKTFEEGVG